MSSLTMKWKVMLVAILVCSAPVWAADQVVIADFSIAADAPVVPAGWQVKEKSGKADFAVVKDDDVVAVRLRSANTSFSLQKEVHVNLKQYPILTWKWKVTKLPDGGDFRKSDTDDQAAQLFIAFSKTCAIVYIWDTMRRRGLWVTRPRPSSCPSRPSSSVPARPEPVSGITETRKRATTITCFSRGAGRTVKRVSTNDFPHTRDVG